MFNNTLILGIFSSLDKPIWDWLELLLIPLLLALLGWFITWKNNKNEREITKNKSLQESFDSYLEFMSKLILENDMANSDDHKVPIIARARTINFLDSADSEKRGLVLQFLAETNLICAPNPIINLNGINLNKTKLRNIRLEKISLKGVHLKNCDFKGANLKGSDFTSSNFENCNLSNSNLENSNLTYADMENVNLTNGNLVKATIDGTNFKQAKMENCLVTKTQFNIIIREKSLKSKPKTNE